MRFLLSVVLAVSFVPTYSPPAVAKVAVQGNETTVHVHGAAVHYTVNGLGPTVIFVHGWTCDETSWAEQVRALKGKYRVITLDLPGHGKSSTTQPSDFSMPVFVEAVEAVRAANRAERVVLVGHSMGAVVIRQYALKYPGHVAGLVSADGPLDVRPIAGAMDVQPPMTPEVRKYLISTMFVPETPKALQTRITDMMLRTSEATAVGASTVMFDRTNLSDTVIIAPALTIYAGKPLFPVNENTKQLLPNWKSVQIAKTGHFVMMEKPRQFNRLLGHFLSKRAQF
jgi:pimeloyl-ACP methyl ester carboxylesterase